MTQLQNRRAAANADQRGREDSKLLFSPSSEPLSPPSRCSDDAPRRSQDKAPEEKGDVLGVLEVYITGFGPFLTINNNPTATLVDHAHTALLQALPQSCQLERGESTGATVAQQIELVFRKAPTLQLPPGVKLCGAEVLEVSAAGVKEAIPRIHQFMHKFHPPEGDPTYRKLVSSLEVCRKGEKRLAEEKKVEKEEFSVASASRRSSAPSHPNGALCAVPKDETSDVLYGTSRQCPSTGVVVERLLSSAEVASSSKAANKVIGNQRPNRLLCSQGCRRGACVRNAFVGRQVHGSVVPAQKVIIHLGVSPRSSGFRLEGQAFNEATFAIPDERNFAPQREKVSQCEDPRLSSVLPVEEIAESLFKLGFDCTATDDPGRFVCNYAYFLSLDQSRKSHIPSLFVHVPTFESAPLQTQISFLTALLGCIWTQCFSCGESLSTAERKQNASP